MAYSNSSATYDPIDEYKTQPYVQQAGYDTQAQAFGVDDRSRSTEVLKRRDLIYKRCIRVLRFATRISSTILSGFIIGSLSYSLAKYFLTRNKIIQGNVHPWATPTVLWPTYMLLAIAVVTFLLNIITICTYVCSVKAANRTSSIAGYIGYAITAVHFIAWAVVTGLFKMANTGSDLWGYSCSDISDQIQPQVQSYLDFGKLCTVQTGAWYSTIIEAVTYFLTFVTLLMVLRRKSHQKRLSALEVNEY